MVVALLALLAALAGPAGAADKVARIAATITGDDIKNGSVAGVDLKNESATGSDIKDGSLTTKDIGSGQVQTDDIGTNAVRGDKIQTNTLDGSDVQDDSLKGGDIQESSLGTVPKAANASSADSADKVDGKDASAFVTQDERLSFQRRMNIGDAPIVLDTFGPFTFHGYCETVATAPVNRSKDRDGRGYSAGSTIAAITVTTSEADSYFEGYSSYDPLNPGDEATVVQQGTTASNSGYGYEIYGLYAPSSEKFVFDDDGQSTAVMVNTRGADCRFFSDR
jgi:hypothetical protein